MIKHYTHMRHLFITLKGDYQRVKLNRTTRFVNCSVKRHDKLFRCRNGRCLPPPQRTGQQPHPGPLPVMVRPTHSRHHAQKRALQRVSRHWTPSSPGTAVSASARILASCFVVKAVSNEDKKYYKNINILYILNT